jgi:plastocyanin
MKILRPMRIYVGIALVCSCACSLRAQSTPLPVTVKVEIVNPKSGKVSVSANGETDASNVVVWLIPIGVAPGASAIAPPAHPAPQVAQTNKSFAPHVSVIQVGTPVQFPNKDPFLHNVFSLFDGKRFDLGFYEAGSSKTVHFDKPGVSFLFCNIHPEMSAAVVTVDTPYFAISDRSGRVSLSNVLPGRYQLNVWYERSLPADLKALTREVTISDSSRSLETIRILENPNFSLVHKNKYGQDYVPPANTGPAYNHP